MNTTISGGWLMDEYDDQLLREIGKAVVETTNEDGFHPWRNGLTCPACRGYIHTNDCPIIEYLEANDEKS